MADISRLMQQAGRTEFYRSLGDLATCVCGYIYIYVYMLWVCDRTVICINTRKTDCLRVILFLCGVGVILRWYFGPSLPEYRWDNNIPGNRFLFILTKHKSVGIWRYIVVLSRTKAKRSFFFRFIYIYKWAFIWSITRAAKSIFGLNWSQELRERGSIRRKVI